MVSPRAIGILSSVGAAVMLALAPASAVAAAGPQVVTFEGAPDHGQGLQSRPKVILISGDGSELLAGHGHASRHPRIGRLRWTTWTGTDSKAWGGWWIDNCTPDCVRGTHIPYRVNLEVYRPEVEQGYDLFTRMKVTFLGKHPSYPYKQTQVFKLRTQSKSFFWG